MDCNDIKIGDLMMVKTSGLVSNYGPYIYGHVTEIKFNQTSNQIKFYIMWDNGNSFWYNRREMQMYKDIVDNIRNG